VISCGVNGKMLLSYLTVISCSANGRIAHVQSVVISPAAKRGMHPVDAAVFPFAAKELMVTAEQGCDSMWGYRTYGERRTRRDFFGDQWENGDGRKRTLFSLVVKMADDPALCSLTLLPERVRRDNRSDVVDVWLLTYFNGLVIII
jgi:hypothetical protein